MVILNIDFCQQGIHFWNNLKLDGITSKLIFALSNVTKTTITVSLLSKQN